jgi:hypothetical protein
MGQAYRYAFEIRRQDRHRSTISAMPITSASSIAEVCAGRSLVGARFRQGQARIRRHGRIRHARGSGVGTMTDWIEIGSLNAIPRRGARCVNTPNGRSPYSAPGKTRSSPSKIAARTSTVRSAKASSTAPRSRVRCTIGSSTSPPAKLRAPTKARSAPMPLTWWMAASFHGRRSYTGGGGVGQGMTTTR